MNIVTPCQNCEQAKSANKLKCPNCGTRLRYKIASEAYSWSWSSLGLFDLIPGVRDLPYSLRFLLMVACVIVLVAGPYVISLFLGL